MHPVLFSLGPLTVHTYGFLIAIGFLANIAVVKFLAQRNNLNVERMLDLNFWTLLVGFLGARVLFVMTRWDYFSSNPVAIFRIWEGGLVFFGGLIAGLGFMIWYCKHHAMSIWRVLDITGPGLVLAHAFGRLGCFTAGCCYGKETTAPWGIKFHSELVDEPLRGIPLHPVQLYEAAALLVLFFGLLWVVKHRKFDGQAMLTYFVSYPIIRSVLEVYRGDLIRGFVIEDWLSTSQFISILIFAGAMFALWYRLNQLKKITPLPLTSASRNKSAK